MPQTRPAHGGRPSSPPVLAMNRATSKPTAELPGPACTDPQASHGGLVTLGRRCSWLAAHRNLTGSFYRTEAQVLPRDSHGTR